ncbi:MFS transporter [Aquirhabdus parva]|uniref:MFS transporter n=1 Tax=Aquirhabdus parva TaxID=2283318 RepID=A0A345P565_9GAMM|nr:MFS transporter [Aquirhabdus parva]AXI02424.1 MFS transporter [Aquirhabdus parva]
MKTIPETTKDITVTNIYPSRALIFLLACSCGLIVANLYYAQPLIGLIAPDIHLSPVASGLIVTLTQIGYCLGLLLLVPLSDLLENRKLVLWGMGGGLLTLIAAALSQTAMVFLFSCFCIGLGSISAQILILVAAHMAPAEVRGRVVGKVMSGLLIGIMMARPVSSFIAASLGWRSVYELSAVAMVILMGVLWRLLPSRVPEAQQHYPELIGSLWKLFVHTPELRRRAAYQATLFASFSLYWTAVPLILASPRFGLTQNGIGLFALVGGAGAVAAPIAGWLADHGKSHLTTGLSITIVALAFLLAWYGGLHSLVALLVAGVILDFGVQTNLVVGQRTLFSLGEHARGRLNGLFIAIFFLGGAVGSALASVSYNYGGWPLVCVIGMIFPILALFLYSTEKPFKF